MARQHDPDHRRQRDRCGSGADQRIDHPPGTEAVVAQSVDGITLRSRTVPTETERLHFVVEFGANSQGSVVLDAVVQHLTEHHDGIAQDSDEHRDERHSENSIQPAFTERGKKQRMNPVGFRGWGENRID